MIQRIKKKLRSGDHRTDLINKNIVGSFGLKFIDVGIGFILVPLSLAYLTQSDYGIWLVISSMVNWLNFFDFGISHGYRNKLAIALSENDFPLAKAYTSTAYVAIGGISFFMALLGMLIVPFVDWAWVLNVPSDRNKILVLVVLTIIVSFSLQLALKIITSVFLANQMPFWNNLVFSLTKVLSAVSIIILVIFTKNDLLLYVFVLSIMPILVLLISTFVFFHKKYKHYRPSLYYFDKSIISDLLGLGVKFFILQIGASMLFMTDNLIIAHVLTPADVTPYQIAQKYFGIVLVLFLIILKPFWSAITEAYAKDDYIWIRKSITSLNKIWTVGFVVSLFLLIVFYPVLSIWVGDEIKVPLILAIQCVIFVSLQSYNSIYTFFLNGTGKIYLQMITGISTLIINIPLSVYFAKYLGLGSAGVLLATNCSILIYVITRKIQYYKIINRRAYGIWAK